MNLPVIIGKGSNNDLLQLDLSTLSHLFISYSEPDHINHYLADVLNTLQRNNVSTELQFACALSREMFSALSHFLKDANLLSLFIRNETTDPAGGSKYLFIRTLRKELKRREKVKQSFGKLIPLVVIIDDIFDIIITKRKYTGLYFLELLTAGKELGIHFIAASTWTYRNLARQLINMKLDTHNTNDKQMAGKSSITIQPLVAELIITPEDLYFFKEGKQTDYTRYFPIREGLESPSLKP